MSAIDNAVQIVGDRLSVHFTDFSINSYPLFLKVKSLPEYDLTFVPETESYRVTAPARFAPMLGAQPVASPPSDLAFAEFLLDDQDAITRLALVSKRFAYWGHCGLGKTLVGLEFARHVVHRTGGRVLIFTINDIVNQWIEEAEKFYGDSLPVLRLDSRDAMKQWAAGNMPDAPMIAVTNYEKMNYRDRADQTVNELRYLAGAIVDENRLKGGGRKQKWAINKSCKGVEFKLSLTATPAPNDTIEYASQASFLEKMRHDGEIIWTYFQRNEKTHRWEVKRHARKAFFEWMSGWSIYVRDPRRYGWRKGFPDVPKPDMIVHKVAITPEQREVMGRYMRDRTGQMSMIDKDDRNAIQRGKLSQIAKGFVYAKKGSGRIVKRIPSAKPGFVAKLIQEEAAVGLQVLVWTVFDAESDILAEELGKLAHPPQFEMLHGKTKPEARLEVLERFRRGETPVLISKAKLLGFGMNFQCCGSMIFSGFNDSYESFFQAICRAVRYLQQKKVRVHLPVVEELEGDMLENLFNKQAKHEAAIVEMEENYLAARKLFVTTEASD